MYATMDGEHWFYYRICGESHDEKVPVESTLVRILRFSTDFIVIEADGQA
jgi:hypothetical protein